MGHINVNLYFFAGTCAPTTFLRVSRSPLQIAELAGPPGRRAAGIAPISSERFDDVPHTLNASPVSFRSVFLSKCRGPYGY